MEWVSHSKRTTHVEYRRSFELVHMPGAGWGFDCDQHGNLLHPHGMANYQACLAGAVDGQPVVDKGVEKYSWSYLEPGIIRCDCGRKLTLHDTMDNTCDCGRNYNCCGQLVRRMDDPDVVAEDDRWYDIDTDLGF